MTRAERTLPEVLDYEFRDPELLKAALTHRSLGGVNNERLEFLGDAVLSMVIAEAVYRARPRVREGDLSRLRANLVKGATLARVATEIRLGDHLRLGSGELKSGGYRRESILADALEAVFGAVYLDGGFAEAKACIERLFENRLSSLPDPSTLKDPKTRLQEYLQARAVPLPVYEVTSVTGEAHDQTFDVSCVVDDLNLTECGSGSSRRSAEQEAAGRVLDRLEGRKSDASAGERHDGHD